MVFHEQKELACRSGFQILPSKRYAHFLLVDIRLDEVLWENIKFACLQTEMSTGKYTEDRSHLYLYSQ